MRRGRPASPRSSCETAARRDAHPTIARDLAARGHDVIAVAGNPAHQALSDPDVLAFATVAGRAVLTANRRHFIQLHRRTPSHAGIIVCTADPDVTAQADRIDHAVRRHDRLAGLLLRVDRLP